jgi:hypothetical protein
MPLEKTFHESSVRLHRLKERVEELRLTVMEDRPPGPDAQIVDHFEYGVEDILGYLNETLQLAASAERAVEPPVHLDVARHALTKCQERFQRMENVFSSSLTSYERLKDLASFASERRRWQPWVSSVKQGIDHCVQSLDHARTSLRECWQEIAERVGTTSVSVRTTAIGQKINAPAAQPEG